MRPEAAAVEPSLARLQRWLQAVVVHPGPIGEALSSGAAASEVAVADVPRVVRASWSMEAADRVDVYHGMYLLRMAEALASDYPAVRHFLGEEGFADLVRDYVDRHPSASYTLNRLGDRLPDYFLEESGGRAAFLHDLARAELAITQAFDEESSPTIDVDALRAIGDADGLAVRLRPIRALRLLSLRHTVVSHLDAARHGRPAPRPRRRASRLLVWRQAYTVLRRELSADEHAVLAALVAGATLEEAVGAVVARIQASRRSDVVFRWFRGWVADGLFAAVER